MSSLVLRNMIRSVCDDGTSPIDTLETMLSPFQVDAQDVVNCIGHIHWDQRLKATSPVGFIQDDLQRIRADASKEDDPQMFKVWLLYAATAISHLWCRQITPRPLLHGPPCDFCAFELPNKPVPWVWLNIEKLHSNLEVMEYHADMPWVKIVLERETRMGALATLELGFFEPKSDANVPTAAAALLEIVIDESLMPTNVESKMDFEGPMDPEMTNFMIVFSRGNAFEYLKTVLVNPKSHYVLEYPVSLHQTHVDK